MNEYIPKTTSYYVQTGCVPGLLALHDRNDALEYARKAANYYNNTIAVYRPDMKTVEFVAFPTLTQDSI